MTDSGENISGTQTPDDGLWLPIAELARVKGKARQTVHERVQKLEEAGLITTRPGPGGTRLVNAAEYDQRVNETTDFAKEQAAETAALGREASWGDTRMRDAQLSKIRYETAIKAMEAKKLAGALVEIDQVGAVIAQVGEEIKRPLDQISLHADELTALAASGGATAVRAKLKAIVFDLKSLIGQALQKLDIRGNGGGAQQ